MLDERFLVEWLGVDASKELKELIIEKVAGETKERLFKNDGSEIDYGYSFPGVDMLKRACLAEVRSQFVNTGRRPVVADIGAGFGTMTWKLLAAGAQVDAIEIQEPSAKELKRRVHGMNPEIWRGESLDQILRVMSGNALKILNDESFNQKYDYVWISQVIHFLTPDEINELKNILNRILKPGGKVLAFANSIHQFDGMDDGNTIATSFETAKRDSTFCPGFMTINAATLIDPFQNRIVCNSVVSSYNQTQMRINNIPIQINAYGKGYLGPTDIDTRINRFEQVKAKYNGYPFMVNRFYQVVNLLDPQTAKLSFSQSGFIVKSFYYDGVTDKKPLSKNKPDNLAVIVLMQKEMDGELEQTILQTCSLFEPEVNDKLAFAIKELTSIKIQNTLNHALSNKNYSLLLRASCANCVLSVVKILLKHAKDLDIKMNEQSSNGNTALDWISKFGDDNAAKSIIIELLSEHGAKNSSSLANEDVEPQLN